jgi:hypothetical protein
MLPPCHQPAMKPAALKLLSDDIASGKVDTVAVDKVDRLTETPLLLG